MLRERLKEMDLRITELAEYMQVSRPTMYKYIDSYDTGSFKSIRKDVLALFNYISENELVGKKRVMNYIITARPSECDGDPINTVKNYLQSNPNSKKSKFITRCFLSDEFNDVICYMADIAPLLSRPTLSDREKEKIAPLFYLKNQIKPTKED